MSKHNEQHQFACYSADVSLRIRASSVGHTVSIDNPVLAHRIISVLRMGAGDTIILFDQHAHSVFELTHACSKKTLVGIVKNYTLNTHLSPAITVLLPLLKREALQEALYSCVELGATDIQLVITKMVHRAESHDQKYMQRLQAIIIAAAEQSKHFSFPVLKAPIPLNQAVEQAPADAARLFFHADGRDLLSTMQTLHASQSEHIIVVVGPEGDCTLDEKKLLEDHSFQLCRLTPTVLRSPQALAVGLGIVRSVMSS